MKKIYSVIAGLLMTASVFAQSPEKMSYQAVVRDASNALVTTQLISMRISILQGGATGTPVYVETQAPTTNANGLVSLEIGTGTVLRGNFATIDWANDTYFVKTETDPTGGSTYTITGTSQLMSVPYALHAKTAENVTNDLVDDADADPTNELQNVSFSNDTLYLSNGGKVFLGVYRVDAFLSDTVSILATKSDVNSKASLSDTVSILATKFNLADTAATLRTDLIQTISRTGTTVTLSNGGTFTDSVGVYTAGTGIDITNNVISTTSGGGGHYVGGHYVGERYGGGIVFYVYDNGAKGLIASLDDLDGGSGVAWSGNTSNEIGSTAQSFYNGATNTTAMEAQSEATNRAGTLCANYTGGSKTDWYLPSLWELNLLYNSAFLINTLLEDDGDAATHGLKAGTYWSSTEYNSTGAWYYNFLNGFSSNYPKSLTYRVRAVRAF